MAAEVSDRLGPSTKELLCCLTGRYGSIQIPCMTVTHKQLSRRTHEGKQHSDCDSVWGGEVKDKSQE